jgi:hypothetical protein
MISKLKENLAQSQARIKKYADQGRFERHFNVGDMVYVKLQPFGQLSLHQSLKLTTKFYGPFKVLQKIGTTT